MQLVVADIDRVDARGAAFQKDLGESTGGGAEVETDAPLRGERKIIQRRCQLDAAAGDIGMGRFVLNRHAFPQFLGRLCDLLTIRLDPSCLNRRLRFRSACGKAVADKENVGALTSIRHRQRLDAPWLPGSMRSPQRRRVHAPAPKARQQQSLWRPDPRSHTCAPACPDR